MATSSNASGNTNAMQPVVSTPLHLGLFPVLDGVSCYFLQFCTYTILS